MRLPCQVVRERDFKLVATSVLNVSETGLLVDANVPVLTGDKVILSFYSPADRGWVDAEATIVRLAPGPQWMGRKLAIGVTFDHIDDASRRSLRKSTSALM